MLNVLPRHLGEGIPEVLSHSVGVLVALNVELKTLGEFLKWTWILQVRQVVSLSLLWNTYPMHQRLVMAYQAEVACHRWNCCAASVLQVYRHSSYKEGFAGLGTLQDVPMLNWSKTVELEASGQPRSRQTWSPSSQHKMEKGLGESL